MVQHRFYSFESGPLTFDGPRRRKRRILQATEMPFFDFLRRPEADTLRPDRGALPPRARRQPFSSYLVGPASSRNTFPRNTPHRSCVPQAPRAPAPSPPPRISVPTPWQPLRSSPIHRTDRRRGRLQPWRSRWRGSVLLAAPWQPCRVLAQGMSSRCKVYDLGLGGEV
jgi:hypothetical protein